MAKSNLIPPSIAEFYGNKLRVRVCGLCWRGDALLMVNHRRITPGNFWAPPGGGLELQESAATRLRKEFMEETGLEIAVGEFRFACELLQPPFHAVELFFEVSETGGHLLKGEDPELAIIDEVAFMSASRIAEMSRAELHGIFRHIQSADDLRTLTGFFTI